jgi:hypothetical protein
MTAYQMEVNNAARYILDNNPSKEGSHPIDIFEFSKIMSIVHCKSKDDVLQDILNAQTAFIDDAAKDPVIFI